MSHIFFRLPESFHPGEFLRSPTLRWRFDDARYFISLILTKFARGNVDEGGWVVLHAAYLRSVMHKHQYAAVVDALLEGGAVVRAPYCVGKRSFGYRLGEQFRRDRHVRVPAIDDRIIGRLRAFHAKIEEDRKVRMLPVHFGLESQQRRLRIDSKLASEIIAALPPASNPFDVQGILVADIEGRDFHLNVGKYGRVSNNITNMKRELRLALRFGVEPLSHVDVSCCQPALIGKVATEQRTKVDDKEQREETGTEEQSRPAEDRSIYDAPLLPPPKSDLARYCDLVQTGEFYDLMLSQLGFRFTRDELKKRFLADVIAKRKANRYGAEYPSDVEDCFRELFPSVYRFIRRTNCDGWEHANLIRELQRQESKLVIETVAADLVSQHPRMFLLTLHDAIYTTPSGIPVVVGAFESAFAKTGFPLTLKVAA